MAGTSIHIPQILWEVITCSRPWYILLAHKSSYLCVLYKTSGVCSYCTVLYIYLYCDQTSSQVPMGCRPLCLVLIQASVSKRVQNHIQVIIGCSIELVYQEHSGPSTSRFKFIVIWIPLLGHTELTDGAGLFVFILCRYMERNTFAINY